MLDPNMRKPDARNWTTILIHITQCGYCPSTESISRYILFDAALQPNRPLDWLNQGDDLPGLMPTLKDSQSTYTGGVIDFRVVGFQI